MVPLTRRTFIARTAAGAALLGAGLAASCRAAARAAAARTAARLAAAPGQRLRLGIIGVGGQGAANTAAVASEEIVALCDVDSRMLDAAAASHPGASRWVDYRRMLADETLDLHGVVISTPDHSHAPAAAMAMERGLAVYVEKPLTHTVEECRMLQTLAERHGVVTQMGTLIHAGENYRRVVEMIRGGVIGRVTAVDCWCPKSWCCGQLTPGAVPPPQLDWDLWQGPIPPQPYVDGVTPANWRRYWAWGSGTLGDMGCHILDLPFWALELQGAAGRRYQVEAFGPADARAPDAVGCPPWLEVTWAFPQEGRDPLILRWFDGGRVPPTVQELGGKDRQDYFGRFMVCFQGTSGFLMANYGEYLLLPPGLFAGGPGVLPRIAASPGHHLEWLNAIRGGNQSGDQSPLCRFDYAAPLTELVLMGCVAWRANRAVEWDRHASLDAAPADLQPWLRERWRPGWSLTASS
ncbi:MAG: Gfo/Idh/MocA family oxidoreductase [Phycisphaerales bacterium]